MNVWDKLRQRGMDKAVYSPIRRQTQKQENQRTMVLERRKASEVKRGLPKRAK